jgi:hypothetical protein
MMPSAQLPANMMYVRVNISLDNLGDLNSGGFLSHLRSPYDYDEPEILQSSSHAFCPMGAEPGQ